MRKTLKQLINDEHFAVQKLEDYGMNIEHYANRMCEHQNELSKILAEAREHTENFNRDERFRLLTLISNSRENRDRATEGRDAAIQELTNIRRELKQYLLDIIKEY